MVIGRGKAQDLGKTGYIIFVLRNDVRVISSSVGGRAGRVARLCERERMQKGEM